MKPVLLNASLGSGRPPPHRMRCRVCGIATQLNDTDPREGFIAGNISFGPNAVDGYVDEDPVTSYAIYFVDACRVPIGEPVATVPKRSGVPNYCCQDDTYRAEVIQRLPLDSDRLVIVPVTNAGPLLVGELTEIISDWVVNKTVGIGTTNGAALSIRPAWSVVLVTFVAVAALLTSRGG